MRMWKEFLNDEGGFVLSSEAVLVGTLSVVGATVGLSAAAQAVNDELAEMAYAFRSLDQSYRIEGQSSGSAWTAGSSYTQPPVEESVSRLKAQVEDANKKAAKQKAEEAEKAGAKEAEAETNQAREEMRRERQLRRRQQQRDVE